MGSDLGGFGSDTQSLYARARTMIVSDNVFYQKHVQEEYPWGPQNGSHFGS